VTFRFLSTDGDSNTEFQTVAGVLGMNHGNIAGNLAQRIHILPRKFKSFDSVGFF
jgi:hypothetical protein